MAYFDWLRVSVFCFFVSFGRDFIMWTARFISFMLLGYSISANVSKQTYTKTRRFTGKQARISLPLLGVGALGYVTCDLDPAELGQIREKPPKCMVIWGFEANIWGKFLSNLVTKGTLLLLIIFVLLRSLHSYQISSLSDHWLQTLGQEKL